MSLRVCTVGFKSPTGISHSVEVEAETLYEAAGLGLARLKKDGWIEGLGPATRLEIVVRAPAARHTLTVTQPVVVGSTFMGVVGVDLLAATVERLLGADLDATEGVHVVVNRVGRVVASTDLEHVVGDLVHGLPDTEWFTGRRRTGDGDGDGSAWRFVTCGDLPLAVLTDTS